MSRPMSSARRDELRRIALAALEPHAEGAPVWWAKVVLELLDEGGPFTER